MKIVRPALIFGCLLAALPAACQAEKKQTTIEIVVNATLCPIQSSDCYSLRVPRVDVSARGPNRTVTGTTNSSGVARFVVEPGTYLARADSFLFEGSQVETNVEVKRGSVTTVDLNGPVAPLKSAAPR